MSHFAKHGTAEIGPAHGAWSQYRENRWYHTCSHCSHAWCNLLLQVAGVEHRGNFTLIPSRTRVITWLVPIVTPSSQLRQHFEDTLSLAGALPTTPAEFEYLDVASTLKFSKQRKTWCHQLFFRALSFWGWSMPDVFCVTKVLPGDRNWYVTWHNSTLNNSNKVKVWRQVLQTFAGDPTTHVFACQNAPAFDPIRGLNISVWCPLRLLHWWKLTIFSSTTPLYKWIKGTQKPLKSWGILHRVLHRKGRHVATWITLQQGSCCCIRSYTCESEHNWHLWFTIACKHWPIQHTSKYCISPYSGNRSVSGDGYLTVEWFRGHYTNPVSH